MIILFLVYSNIVLGGMLYEKAIDVDIEAILGARIYRGYLDKSLDLQICESELKKEKEGNHDIRSN